MPQNPTCNKRNPDPPCGENMYEKKRPNGKMCCYKTPKSNKKTKKQTVGKASNASKSKVGKVHKVRYLSHLYSEGYASDITQKIYGKPFALDKRDGFIPFSEITEIISEDMETQYQDKDVGRKGHAQKLTHVDSAHWYNDCKKFKKNHVITDNTPGSSLFNRLSRSDFEAWLVVEKKGKLGLVMFPMSPGMIKDGFSDGDTVNYKGEMIHPITKKIVKVM